MTRSASNQITRVAMARARRVGWRLAWLLLLAVVLAFLLMAWRTYGDADPAAYRIYRQRVVVHWSRSTDGDRGRRAGSSMNTTVIPISAQQ